MIDNIVGIGSLPVGIILFMNIYGFSKINSIFGIDLILFAAIVLVLIQVSNIIGSHIMGEYVVLGYIVHILLVTPSILYFLNYVISMPGDIVNTFPIIFASFITIEGLYSFFF
jgi:hypothetical protein